MRKLLWLVLLLLAGCVLVLPNSDSALYSLLTPPTPTPFVPSIVYQIPHRPGVYDSPVPGAINIYLPLKGVRP